MSDQKLVRMANQIAAFFAHEGEERSVDDIVNHLEQFWDPRMRASIVAHLDSGGEGLDPLARSAVEMLRKTANTT
jgi:formate dehydrogenase subunit delta